MKRAKASHPMRSLSSAELTKVTGGAAIYRKPDTVTRSPVYTPDQTVADNPLYVSSALDGDNPLHHI